MKVTDMAAIRQRVDGALGAARADFASALDGEDPTFVFLQTKLRVDRRRGIVATSAEPRDWHDDSIDGSTVAGRAFLGLFVGPHRYFQVGEFVEYLAAACRNDSVPSETHAALFTNLVVAEPFFNPERERAIWLAVALELAAGQRMTNVFAILPGLRTDTDLADWTASEDRSTSWARLESSLLARAIPSSTSLLEAARTEHELAEVLKGYRESVDAYIDQHLLAAVAASVGSSGD
jgi:hypothetical protein